MNNNALKIMSMAVTGAGLLITAIGDFVADKKLEVKINAIAAEKAKEAVEQILKERGL